MTEKPKGKKYQCKWCPQSFDKKTELMNHRRSVLAQRRREAFGRNQLMPTPRDIPKRFKILGVRQDKMSTTLASTFFMPPTWRYVKVYTPVKTEKGIWVYFEPLEVYIGEYKKET